MKAKKAKPPTMTIRVSVELAAMARVVASLRQMRVIDYTDAILRAAVVRDHDREMAKIAQQQKGER